MLSPEALSAAFLEACLAELQALKPGNVHRFAAGHGMTVRQFETSAAAAAADIAQPGLAVGQRILAATRASFEAAGCNTNLGIVILAAPLLQAAMGPGGRDLRARLSRLLAGLDRADAEATFAAIRLAAPGGLGKADRHDVQGPAEVTLREAMSEAAPRDFIARQYVSDYEDIFALGLPALNPAGSLGVSPEWAVTRLYLSFLAGLPDSHVLRKQGQAAAEGLMARAKPFAERLAAEGPSDELQAALLAFDGALKAEGINPGTSADLTVATLLAARLQHLLEAAFP